MQISEMQCTLSDFYKRDGNGAEIVKNDVVGIGLRGIGLRPTDDDIYSQPHFAIRHWLVGL